jgi:Zn-dependent M28 family amino/carboxypeptidase
LRRIVLMSAVAAALVPLSPAEAQTTAAHRAAVYLAGTIGSRPAASRAELRAHRWVAGHFRRAGLIVRTTPFAVPRRGRSRNVVGVFRGRERCLKIVMAHADSVPAGPGAVDNASGVGVLVGLASRLRVIRPPCDVWLVATGAEERPVTRTADHLGALALVKRIRQLGAGRRLRYALSLDMVGIGRRFWLRSPRSAPRGGVEREVLAAGRRRGVTLRWVRDSSTGNSDHREFELVGLPGLVVQTWGGGDACYHRACDTARRLDRRSLAAVQGIAESVLRRR